MELLGTFGCRELREPGKECGAIAFGANSGKSDQVVDVQVLPPSEVFAETKARYRERLASIAQGRESITRSLLIPHTVEERGGVPQIT